MLREKFLMLQCKFNFENDNNHWKRILCGTNNCRDEESQIDPLIYFLCILHIIGAIKNY